MKDITPPSDPSHNALVAAALAKMNLPAVDRTEGQRIIDRAIDASRRIMDEVRPDIAAKGYLDRRVHGLAIGKKFLEEFMTWSKDDLIYLCATIHTDSVIERAR